MENKEQDETLKKVQEKNPPQKHDADNGNDITVNEILQKEKLIDPGNEHHHPDAAGNNAKLSHPADSGTTGPQSGEGENDEPYKSGEAG
ncbi:MAG: hypothetical protein ABIO55_09685 [Ginsengibacter sp.]